ncbi:hypothetical protein Tco_1532630 [Tanacetum coccineum]
MKLYDALMNSLLVDEDDMDKQLDDQPSQTERHHDDQDPHTDADKETKKRKRKDSDASSSKKSKDKEESSKGTKAPSGPSPTQKAVDDDELIQDGVVDDTEMAQDDDMVADDMPHDDDAPTQDWSKWFKQDVVMVNAEKYPVTFDDLMGSTVDFTKFAKNCLKKDKITKADLEGPAFKLLKGNCRNYIELEYNMEHNPLPLQGPFGRTTIPVDFFFNKYLEYLKTGNTKKKYASSLTKPKASRPQVRCDDLDLKEPYTILHKPRGIVYLNKNNGKYLMRDNELYKYSDGMLKPVRDILNSRLHNFELGYNIASMPKRAWTEKDHTRTASMLEKIDQTLLKRRMMRKLSKLFGGNQRESRTDYKRFLVELSQVTSHTLSCEYVNRWCRSING